MGGYHGQHHRGSDGGIPREEGSAEQGRRESVTLQAEREIQAKSQKSESPQHVQGTSACAGEIVTGEAWKTGWRSEQGQIRKDLADV